MLLTLEGIILKTTKYAENSLVLHVFTRERGMQGFIIGGVHGKKGRTKGGIVQIFNLVKIVAYMKEGASLWRIKEIKNHIPYQGIPFDISKSTLAFFVNEVLYKSLRNIHEPDHYLYDFAINSAQILDLTEKTDPHFHLEFMLKLTKILGFYPNKVPAGGDFWVDLKDAEFVSKIPLHPMHLGRDHTQTLVKFIRQSEKKEAHDLTRQERRNLAENLANFYDLQLEGFGQLKTLAVLKEVLE
jgi:DNA repair protein RecO (recombination protein O)